MSSVISFGRAKRGRSFWPTMVAGVLVTLTATGAATPNFLCFTSPYSRGRRFARFSLWGKVWGLHTCASTSSNIHAQPFQNLTLLFSCCGFERKGWPPALQAGGSQLPVLPVTQLTLLSQSIPIAANRAQTVHCEPNAVFIFHRLTNEPERNHPFAKPL